MANEATITKGSYVSLIASEQELDAAFCTLSGALSGVLSAAEQTYPTLDFRFTTATDIPTEGGTVNLYRVPSDGTTDSPTPTSAYTKHYVGSFVLDNVAAAAYYLYGVENVSENDKFIWENGNGSTVTGELSVRARTVGPA